MTTIVFFNNKGGVGKTSLVYHLAWMFAELGLTVVAADSDPQANLTSMFLEEDQLEDLWSGGGHPRTIVGAIEPVVRRLGDIQAPHLEKISSRIHLIPGYLGLSGFEEPMSEAWLGCHEKDEAAFKIMSAFYRAALIASDSVAADLVLFDVGANLGAINRAALIASQHVVIPLASDLLSLQALRSLGPQLNRWRTSWAESRLTNPELILPSGEMAPAGYIVLQHGFRIDRPVTAYRRWMAKAPNEYREYVLNRPTDDMSEVGTDPECLAVLKHYRSLMQLAIESHKPMFFLKPADGAIGAHLEAVRDCFRDFRALAIRIAEKCNIALPSLSLQ